MAVQDAKSVRLIQEGVGQLSPGTKASDIIFLDNVDLQTKFDNNQLVNTAAFNGITAISPTVTVVTNTDTEYRLKIKSINGTIVSPNLKGKDSEVVAAEIRAMFAELEAKFDTVEELENTVEVLTRSTAEISRRIDGIENDLTNIYTKDEVSNIMSDCVTSIAVDNDNLIVSKVGTENDTVRLWSSLSNEDIESIF